MSAPWPQLQAWATPEMFIRVAKQALQASFDSCQSEFTFTVENLEPASVYSLDISADKQNWEPHIFFALQTSEEIASGSKSIRINNDYEGNYWFRARLIKDASGDQNKIISSSTKPGAALLPAPEITISNLTDITAGNADGSLETYGIPSLATLEDNIGLQSRMSGLENHYAPLAGNMYVAFQKRYAARWHDLNNFGSLASDVGHVQQITVSTPVVGGVVRYTRDGSDPTENSPELTYNGIERAAYPGDDSFKGVIKARCFKDGCKSPLAIVAIDKAIYQQPYTTASGVAASFTGYCDLPQGDRRSGLDCETLYGSADEFTNEMVLSAPSQATAAFVDYLHKYGSSVEERVDRLGWTNHLVTPNYQRLTSLSWNQASPRWYGIPSLYNWISFRTSEGAQGSVQIPPTGGTVGVNPDITTAVSAAVVFSLPGASAIHPGVTLAGFDLVLSPIGITNPRDDYWNAILGFVEDIPEPDIPEVPPTKPDGYYQDYEDFEQYAETSDAESAVLDLGFGYSLAWVVTDYTTTSGFEDWEPYTSGVVADGSDLNSDVDEYNRGEGYQGYWVFQEELIYLEDWNNFTDGDVEPYYLDVLPGYSGYWVVPPPYVMGDDMETLVDQNPITDVNGDTTLAGHPIGTIRYPNFATKFLISNY